MKHNFIVITSEGNLRRKIWYKRKFTANDIKNAFNMGFNSIVNNKIIIMINGVEIVE